MSTTGLAETALPPDIFRGLQPIRSDAERATAAWNAAMANQAVALEAQGVSPRDIFLQTRTWRGQDGKLRQEAFAALPERRASTMPMFGKPSAVGEFFGGFMGAPRRFSVMDPEAQRLQAARDVGQQASVAAELYGAASPFAIASTMARRGQMMGVSPLTVFQGSPHRFTKLDSSKIGTGEGAQSYGYGLYFAENPKVAKTYMQNERIYKRQSGGLTPLQERISDAMDNGVDANTLFSQLSSMGYKVPKKEFATPYDAFMNEWRTVTNMNTGSLYTIDLPDRIIDRMLDWDKPLSQQPKTVQEFAKSKNPSFASKEPHFLTPSGDVIHWSELLENVDQLKNKKMRDLSSKIFGGGEWVDYGDYILSKTTGGDLYRSFSAPSEWSKQASAGTGKTGLNDVEASALLRQAGIPGIKYLDQGSRGTGKGTRNFVVFPGEEEALTILSRD